MGRKVGTVFWITGLSGAGKTTLAHALLPYFNNAVFLDGDELRLIFGTVISLGFDDETRRKLGFSYGKLCKNLSEQGFDVIIATICMYHDVRQHNRDIIKNYCEVFLDVSEETRRKRDPKKLYEKEKKGLITEMVGLKKDVELPLNPTIYIGEKESLESAVQKILIYKDSVCG